MQEKKLRIDFSTTLTLKRERIRKYVSISYDGWIWRDSGRSRKRVKKC